MKLFSIDDKGKFIPYNEKNFKNLFIEKDLEDLIEKNPEHFFEDNKILIIGRQVTTNLNSSIDLLGVDVDGNTVVIELKRDKTSRETIAQILEYASFVENLDYSQLNEIFKDYTGEEINLEDYYREYFQSDANGKVSFNKSTKLVIVAQEISNDIKQIALYLRKKGIDIYCAEFKYFETKSQEKIISLDYVVGNEDFISNKVKTFALPKIDDKQFLNSLDENGVKVFKQIFEYAKSNNLKFKWGSRGFSLNLEINDEYIVLFMGYNPLSILKQCILTRFENIEKKVNDSEEITEFYKNSLKETGNFLEVGKNLKWIIDKNYTENEIRRFLDIIDKVIFKIKEKGLREY